MAKAGQYVQQMSVFMYEYMHVIRAFYDLITQLEVTLRIGHLNQLKFETNQTSGTIFPNICVYLSIIQMISNCL